MGVFSCGPGPLTNSISDACETVNRQRKLPYFIHHYENFGWALKQAHNLRTQTENSEILVWYVIDIFEKETKKNLLHPHLLQDEQKQKSARVKQKLILKSKQVVKVLSEISEYLKKWMKKMYEF